jgi:hypothetical protein
MTLPAERRNGGTAAVALLAAQGAGEAGAISLGRYWPWGQSQEKIRPKAALADVQVVGVIEGSDDGGPDGGPDGGQVGRPAAGAAGRGIFAESHVPELLSGQDGTNGTSFTDRPGRAMINYSPSPYEVLHRWQVPAG